MEWFDQVDRIMLQPALAAARDVPSSASSWAIPCIAAGEKPNGMFTSLSDFALIAVSYLGTEAFGGHINLRHINTNARTEANTIEGCHVVIHTAVRTLAASLHSPEEVHGPFVVVLANHLGQLLRSLALEVLDAEHILVIPLKAVHGSSGQGSVARFVWLEIMLVL